MRVQATEAGEDSEPDDQPTTRAQKKKKFTSHANSLEARFLTMFVSTKTCRRKVWDLFFNNRKKCEYVTYIENKC